TGPAEPLERVRRGARLPRAAAQDHRSRFPHLTRRLEDLTLRLHRAGPGDRHHVRPSDRHAPGKTDDGILALLYAAHLLVRPRDVDDLLDTGKRFESRCVLAPVVAHQPDGGPLGPRHRLCLVDWESTRLNSRHDQTSY